MLPAVRTASHVRLPGNSIQDYGSNLGIFVQDNIILFSTSISAQISHVGFDVSNCMRGRILITIKKTSDPVPSLYNSQIDTCAVELQQYMTLSCLPHRIVQSL